MERSQEKMSTSIYQNQKYFISLSKTEFANYAFGINNFRLYAIVSKMILIKKFLGSFNYVDINTGFESLDILFRLINLN